jgi:CHAD domain-containing protein
MLRRVKTCDVRTLHRTRVASRRLRELLPVLEIEHQVTTDIGRRLRKVTRRLGKIRELDVLLLLIDALNESGRYDAEALHRVAAAVTEEREQRRARLKTKLPSSELKRVASKLDKLAGELATIDRASARTRASTRGLRWAVDARMERRASALKVAIEEAGALHLSDRLHGVRIALKKLRYAIELAVEIGGDDRIGPVLTTLKRNQDLLGRWHDRQVLVDRVRHMQASLTPPSISAWRRLDAVVTMLDHECRRLHARYVRNAAALIDVCDRILAAHETPVPTESPAAPRRANGVGRRG